MSSSEENNSENQDSSSESRSSTKSNPSNADHLEMIQEIRDLTSQTRMVRIASVVLVLLIFSLFGLSIYNHIRKEFPQNNEEAQVFVKKIQEQANISLIPRARKMLEETLADSREEVSRELKVLWENRGTEVVGMAAEELDTLVRGVPQKAIESYNKAINQALTKKLGGFELPEGGSGRLASGRLAAAIQEGLLSSSTNRTADIIAVMFEPHIMELSSMSNHLNAIYDGEHGALQGDEKQFTLNMALTLMERVNMQLREAESSLLAQKEARDIKQKENEDKGKNNKKK